MSETISQYAKSLETNIDRNLYKKLSEKPIEVVQRFYNFNKYKTGLQDLFSIFPEKIEKNLAVTKKVLEERAK